MCVTATCKCGKYSCAPHGPALDVNPSQHDFVALCHYACHADDQWCVLAGQVCAAAPAKVPRAAALLTLSATILPPGSMLPCTTAGKKSASLYQSQAGNTSGVVQQSRTYQALTCYLTPARSWTMLDTQAALLYASAGHKPQHGQVFSNDNGWIVYG